MEGFLEVAIETLLDELVGLTIGEFAGHGDDFGQLQVSVIADELEDVVTVDIAEVDIQKQHMRSELFTFDASLEATVCGVHFVIGLFGENFFEHADDLGFVIDDEDAGAPALQTIEGNVVLFHELDQGIEGNSSILGTGNAVAPQLPGVEPFADGAWGDVTNFGDLPSGEDIFLSRHSGTLSPLELPIRSRLHGCL